MKNFDPEKNSFFVTTNVEKAIERYKLYLAFHFDDEEDDVDSDNEILSQTHTTKFQFFNSLSLALELATDGTTIFVEQNTFTEPIVISKNIQLIGVPKGCDVFRRDIQNSIFHPKSFGIVCLKGDGSIPLLTVNSDCKIRNFSFSCDAKNTQQKRPSIVKVLSGHSTIIGCRFQLTRDTKHCGVHICNNSKTLIQQCSFSGGRAGIVVNENAQCNVINCEFSAQVYGIAILGNGKNSLYK